jgi:hypothetical protein
MIKYLAEKSLQNQIQIKVEEISAEDYQISEHVEPAIAIDSCHFCNSSDSLGMSANKIVISNFTCPSCGRCQRKTGEYKCPFCSKILVTISQFRQHFFLDHGQLIISQLKCFVCKLFFFNDKARDVHGQITHCLDCRSQCFRDKSLMIPFEDHENSCPNKSIGEGVILAEAVKASVEIKKLELPKVSRDQLLVERIIGKKTVVAQKSTCKLCHNQQGVQKPPQTGVLYCCCPSCGLTVPNVTSNPAACSVCPYKAEKISQIRLHFMIRHDKTVKFYKCADCSMVFFSLLALSFHTKVCGKHLKEDGAVNQMKDIEPTACPICLLPSTRKTSFDLNNQLFSPCIGCGRNVNGQMRKKCGICEKSCNIRLMMKHYPAAHEDRKLFPCLMNCGNHFLTQTAMNQHKICHTLRCPCGEVTKNHRAMEKHRENCQMEMDLEQVTVEETEEPAEKKRKMEKDPFEETEKLEAVDVASKIKEKKRGRPKKTIEKEPVDPKQVDEESVDSSDPLNLDAVKEEIIQACDDVSMPQVDDDPLISEVCSLCEPNALAEEGEE